MPWARLAGALSHGHMKRDRRRAASLRSAPSRRRQARASGAQPAVCTAISRGARAHDPGGGGDGESLRQRADESAAADLNEQRVDLGACGGERLGHLEGERARAFHREPVVGPLHAERNGAGGDRGARGAHARVAGLALLAARRRPRSAPSSPSRRTTLGSASAGMKTSSGQSAARAITAAASAALPQEAIASRRARKSLPRARPDRSRTPR